MGICLQSTEVAYTIESGTYQLGADAFHTEGIMSVEFKVDDGVNPAVTSNVLQESPYNKHALAMWCFNSSLDLSTLNDGPVTVTRTAFANDSTSLAITDTITNNSSSGFTPSAVYADSAFTGTSDGSFDAPYKNVGAAAQALATADGSSDAGGHTIYVKAGAHPYSKINSSYPSTSRGWLTITAAPGESKSTVSFTDDQLLRGVGHIHFKDITLEGGAEIRPDSFSSADGIWVEDCTVTGPGNTVQNYRFADTGDSSTSYVTETTLTDVANVFVGFQMVRGCTATGGSEDSFKACKYAVNTTCHNNRKTVSSFHGDGVQLTGGSHTNYLFKSLLIYDSEDQQMFFHDATGGGPYTDVWYVNCLFQSATSIPFSQWNEDHVGTVALWCTLVGQQFQMRGEKNFTASGVRWINCAFETAAATDTTINTPAKFLAQGCHYTSTPNPAQYLTGTVGDPMFESPGSPNWDYRPRTGSPLIGSGVAFFNAGPPGSKGIGSTAAPNIGAWGDASSGGGGGLTSAVYEDSVPVEPTGWTHQGTDLMTIVSEVFTDVTDELSEGIAFFSATPTFPDASAPWTTYYSIRVGIRKPIDGSNWTVYMHPSYGSPKDKNLGNGNGNKPYYSRLTITVDTGASTIDLDSNGSAYVIGNGQSIPPTVFTWNPNTNAVVSTDFAGKDYAFIETTRIHEAPNETGFSDDGEFTPRYDHTVDNEGRDVFMAAACWPTGWIASNGRFVRGDVPLDASGGFTTTEGLPYARPENIGSTVYPVTQVAAGDPDQDKNTWSNSWKSIPRPDRCTSGVAPYCLNIISRHDASDEILRNLDYAWLLKRMAAMHLQQFPSPNTPHTSNQFTYNYEDDAMRAKGRVLGSLTLLFKALAKLCLIRDQALDPEAFELRDACQLRTVEILNLLKADFDADSYLSYQLSGSSIRYYEMGHYFTNLLTLQESIEEVYGTPDPKVTEMLEQFARDLHSVHVEWITNDPHPFDASATYTGATQGWYIPYDYYVDAANRHQSAPSTGLSPQTTIMAHQWAKVNGINNGAKQDAIIAQDDGINYKWQLGSSPPQTLYVSIDLEGTGTVEQTITETVGLSVDFCGTGLLEPGDMQVTGEIPSTSRKLPTITLSPKTSVLDILTIDLS